MVSKKRKIHNSGILSNLYIPPLRAIQLERELQKLPPDSLYNLTELWLTISSTQPTLTRSDKKEGVTKDVLVFRCKEKLEELKLIKSKTQLKRRLINLILADFYSRGLNTLQLAQIDAQLLVDKPGSSAWVSSTVKLINSANEIPKNEDDIGDSSRNQMIDKLTNFNYKLNSRTFLENFVVNLSNLYLTHVYISRHPYYDLILIRVQMYDYSLRRPIDSATTRLISDITNSTLGAVSKLEFEQEFQMIMSNRYRPTNSSKFGKPGLKRQVQMQNKPQVRSHKPFYVLLPIDSPHIIHSPYNSDDIAAKLVMQTLETTLMNIHSTDTLNMKRSVKLESKTLSSIVLDNRIKIFRDSDIAKPIRNLNSVFMLKGLSRFGAALGAWTPYANGDIDMDILGDEYNHLIIQQNDFIDLTSDTDEQDDANAGSERDKDRGIVANLKFKGSTKKMDVNKILQRRVGYNITNSSEEIDINEENFINTEVNRLKDKYASIIPIQETEFNVKSEVVQMNGLKTKEKFSFKIELLGTDIFGGLHELAEKGIVDPYTVPYWLTGEYGTTRGKIREGKLA